jgi:hypothetical protein
MSNNIFKPAPIKIDVYHPVSSEQAAVAFLKSLYIDAFPCGRRRSTKVDNNYHIPFDPEARLNTEANNRKGSGLNGFTTTYLSDWTDKALTLALAGYLFTINVTDLNDSENYRSFGKELASILQETNSKYLYANILIEDTPLYHGKVKDLDYDTSILGSLIKDAIEALDLEIPIKEFPEAERNNADYARNYYFSGLAFSTVNLAYFYEQNKNGRWDPLADNLKTRYEYTDSVKKRIVSLCILEKTGEAEESWKIHEPARLPNITHGTTSNSIILGDTTIDDNLTVQNNVTVANLAKSLDIEATNKAKTKLLEVTDTAEIKETLNVQNTDKNAQANIDKADIEYADIADTDITVARIDKLHITGTDNNKTLVAEADITNLTAASAKVTTVTVPFKSDSKNTILNDEGIDAPYINADSIIADLISATPVNGNSVSMSGGDLTVDSTATVNVANINNATFKKTVIVEGTLIATEELKDDSNKPVNNVTIKRAGIETITSTDVNTTRMTADDSIIAPALYQKVGSTAMKVPIIELEARTVDDSKQVYKLKISRIELKTN